MCVCSMCRRFTHTNTNYRVTYIHTQGKARLNIKKFLFCFFFDDHLRPTIIIIIIITGIYMKNSERRIYRLNIAHSQCHMTMKLNVCVCVCTGCVYLCMQENFSFFFLISKCFKLKNCNIYNNNNDGDENLLHFLSFFPPH